MGQAQVLADHTTVADRYTLVSPLGRGGMGQVWEARDIQLDRKVAVKLLATDAFAAGQDPGLDVLRFTSSGSPCSGRCGPRRSFTRCG